MATLAQAIYVYLWRLSRKRTINQSIQAQSTSFKRDATGPRRICSPPLLENREPEIFFAAARPRDRVPRRGPSWNTPSTVILLELIIVLARLVLLVLVVLLVLLVLIFLLALLVLLVLLILKY